MLKFYQLICDLFSARKLLKMCTVISSKRFKNVCDCLRSLDLIVFTICLSKQQSLSVTVSNFDQHMKLVELVVNKLSNACRNYFRQHSLTVRPELQ